MNNITICIPTFNQCKSLSKLLNQIYKFHNNIPVIVSDNGSTDNTNDILEIYKKKIKKLKIFRLERNFGFDYNYLKCVKNVRTKYFWVLGSDDEIYFNSIQNLYKIIKYLKFPNGITFIDNKKKNTKSINYNRIKKFDIAKHGNNLGKICLNVIEKKKFFYNVKKRTFNYGYIQLYFMTRVINKEDNWFIYNHNLITKTNYDTDQLSKRKILERLNSEIKGYLFKTKLNFFKKNKFEEYRELIFKKNIRPWILFNLSINSKNDVKRIMYQNYNILKNVKKYQLLLFIINCTPEFLLKIIIKLKLTFFNE